MQPAAPVHFRDGRLYIDREASEQFLGASGTVILLRQEDDLMVLPVRHAASGGYVLKIRNAAGDRVVSAADFFRDQGLSDDAAWQGRFRVARDARRASSIRVLPYVKYVFDVHNQLTEA